MSDERNKLSDTPPKSEESSHAEEPSATSSSDAFDTEETDHGEESEASEASEDTEASEPSEGQLNHSMRPSSAAFCCKRAARRQPLSKLMK